MSQRLGVVQKTPKPQRSNQNQLAVPGNVLHCVSILEKKLNKELLKCIGYLSGYFDSGETMQLPHQPIKTIQLPWRYNFAQFSASWSLEKKLS